MAKVHDEGFEAEGVVQVSPQDQDGGIQVSPRVQVSPQEHFGGSQVAPQDQGGGSQDSPRGQFGGGQASPRDQGGGSQVSPRVVRREPSITSRSGGVDKHRKLEAKPSLSIASGDHQAAKSSRRVKKSEDSLLKQKGRYSQWGYTRNGAVFSMGRCSKRGGALNGAGPYQLRSKAQVVAGGSWSVLAAPQEVTMRSGGQVVEEADSRRGDAAEKARAEALWRSRNLSMSCYHEDKLLVRFSIYFFGKINFDELICVQN